MSISEMVGPSDHASPANRELDLWQAAQLLPLPGDVTLLRKLSLLGLA